MRIPWPEFITRVDREPLAFFWLRIALASILIYRESLNTVGALFDPDLSSQVMEPAFFLGVGILLLAGIGTRLCYLTLTVLYIQYNFRLGVMNLGPLLLVPLCWTGAVLDRDPLYSFDRRLMARSAAYRWLAQWPGATVSAETCNFVFGILFFVYAVNSFAALNFHLRDPYWVHGQTVHALLTNSFLSRYWDTFRWIEARWPAALIGFSTAALVLQTCFQALMLPLVFRYWGRWFVVLQGFAFFLFSLAFLQLSVLPAVEMVTWMLVFGRWIRTGRQGNINVWLSVTPARFAVLALLAIASTISVGNTVARSLGKDTGYTGSRLERAIAHVSIWPPDVFNFMDLKMGEQWYVIYRSPGAGMDRDLVPVFSEAGSRMYYHSSDILYFGNTLPWRRWAIFIPDWTKNLPPAFEHLVERMCMFDFRLNGFRTPQTYLIYVYRDRSMQLELSPAERYERRLAFSREFDIGN